MMKVGRDSIMLGKKVKSKKNSVSAQEQVKKGKSTSERQDEPNHSPFLRAERNGQHIAADDMFKDGERAYGYVSKSEHDWEG